jgi:hypothetical protein
VWYVAGILVGQADQAGSICETSQVLLEAPTAMDAYDKALRWADAHVEHTALQVIGVEWLRGLGPDRPGDGDEIGGSFSINVDSLDGLRASIPPPADLAAILHEGVMSKLPVSQQLSDDQIDLLRRLLPRDEK